MKGQNPQNGQQQAHREGITDTSSTSAPSPSADTITKDTRRIQRYVDALQRHRAQVISAHVPPRPTTPPTIMSRRFDRLEIRYSLGKAMDYLALKQIYHAREEVHHALQIADHTDNAQSLARCFYWLGRIEYQQRNLATAHAHFRAALLCAFDRGTPESCDVAFYLEASRPKAPENDHGHDERGPSDHGPGTHDGQPSQSAQRASSSESQRKRKRESPTWDLPLRPSS